jgi:hypothetical protein
MLFIRLYTAQHVSGTVVPIIRSLSFTAHVACVHRVMSGSMLLPVLSGLSEVFSARRCHRRATVVCAPDDGWKYHPKHVEQFPDMNKLCNVASC